MHYTLIPHTSLKPALICLGSTNIGSAIDRETSFKLFDVYAEHGGNFIDTASVYGNWLPIERNISEKTIGLWLKSRHKRAEMIVATKGAHPDLATMHIPRLSRAEITEDVEDSLKNLQTEVIDLYWLHRDDPQHPVEDIVETMNGLVQAGKIRYFGCSNWWPARIQAAQTYAAGQGLAGFVANQMMWSLAAVEPAVIRDKTVAWMDEEMKQYHQKTGLAAIPYSSQAHGLFQRMAQGTVSQMSSNQRGMYQLEENQRREENQPRFERVKQLAAQTGLSVTEIVLGYLQAQPFTTVPIVGCRTVEQLQDSLKAAEVKLDAAQVQYLEGGGNH